MLGGSFVRTQVVLGEQGSCLLGKNELMIDTISRIKKADQYKDLIKGLNRDMNIIFSQTDLQ